jgi:hypothetical protein
MDYQSDEAINKESACGLTLFSMQAARAAVTVMRGGGPW